MENIKVGKLIHKLRTEQRMTQRQLADRLSVSDKAVSKWERGLGCPDVSLLTELSDIFSVNIEQILRGDLSPNEADGGNMKKIRFYVCPQCGNLLTSSSGADISCCGRKLEQLKAQKADEAHTVNVETVENDYFITFDHDMTKEHYISFAAFVIYDRVTLIKLYPEQSAEVRFPKSCRGRFLWYCSEHGLFEDRI